MAATLDSILVASRGDPRSPRTWSGTPANLCTAFERAGLKVIGVDIYPEAPRWLEVPIKAASKVYYFNSNYARLGRVEGPWRARRARAAIARAPNARHVLHLHALDVLAVREADQTRQHSILLDTTWHIWRQFSAYINTVSERLAADADRAERRVLNAATHCFPLSEYVARDLIAHYGVPRERITVVGTGRGALMPYFGPKDYRNGMILFAAKERFADKGGYQLLEGFKLARTENPRLNLMIVGRPEYETEFTGIDGVAAHGHVSLDQLQALFNAASLFAMPAAFEPWGLVYLEALACRTPVLGLSTHAVPEITRDGRYGFCLREATPVAVATALLRAFDNPDRLAEMGHEGQEHCLDHFTWDKTAERIVNALGRSAAAAVDAG